MVVQEESDTAMRLLLRREDGIYLSEMRLDDGEILRFREPVLWIPNQRESSPEDAPEPVVAELEVLRDAEQTYAGPVSIALRASPIGTMSTPSARFTDVGQLVIVVTTQAKEGQEGAELWQESLWFADGPGIVRYRRKSQGEVFDGRLVEWSEGPSSRDGASGSPP